MFVCWKKSTILAIFWWAESESIFRFFPARQDPETILMSIPETLKTPFWSGLGKRHKGMLRNQSTRGFFGFESSFQNCFWYVFSTSGLSQICKIRNVWKLTSPISRNTLIPCSEKCSHFGRKIIQKTQKWSWKFFRHKGFYGFGTSCFDILKPRYLHGRKKEALLGRNFLLPFLKSIHWDIPAISYFTDLRQDRGPINIPKQIWKLEKTKENRCTLIS
jgi:hypothetical protein